MLLMDAGCRPDLWEDIPPNVGNLTKAANCMGSDQGWISYKMRGEKPAHWMLGGDGVYARRLLKDTARGAAPVDARLIIFAGKPDPWDELARVRWPWLKYHHAEELLEGNKPSPAALSASIDDAEIRYRHLQSIRPTRSKIAL